MFYAQMFYIKLYKMVKHYYGKQDLQVMIKLLDMALIGKEGMDAVRLLQDVKKDLDLIQSARAQQQVQERTLQIQT